MISCAPIPRQHRYILLLAIAAAVASSICYLFWPLTQDVCVHFGGVHQAWISGRGVANIWNFRPINYNLYLLGLYRAATSQTSYFNLTSFDPIVRGIHLCVLIGGSIVWSRGIAELHRLGSYGRRLAAAFMVFAVTACWTTIPLQAEDVGVTLLLYAWGCSARSKLWYVALGGALAGLLPMIKGTTAVYALVAFASSYAAGGWRACALSVATFLGVCGGSLAVTHALAPIQLPDLLEAATLQGSRITLWVRIERIPRAVSFLFRQPILVPGLVGTVFYAAALWRKQSYAELGVLASAWLIGITAVFVQGIYYTYHFAVGSTAAAYGLTMAAVHPTRFRAPRHPGRRLLLLGGVAAAVLVAALRTGREEVTEAPIVLTCITIALLVAALLTARIGHQLRAISLFSVALALWLGGKSAPTYARISRAWEGYDRSSTTLADNVHATVGVRSELLLAAYGNSARHLDVVSACRHYFPVPLARFSKGAAAKFEALAGYREVMNCYRNYRGRYMLWEVTWFKKDLLARTGIFRRYAKVHSFVIGGRKYQLLERRAEELKPERDKTKRRSKRKAKPKAAQTAD